MDNGRPCYQQQCEIEKNGVETEREEYEPFGQSVRTTPPVIVDPPPSQGSLPITNDSMFPEWQCLLPKEVMPSHCGLKMLADEKMWFGKWGADRKEGNTTKITDSPVPDLELFSPMNEMMSYTLTSSSIKMRKRKQ